MQKLKMHSADITAQNIEKIAALFPNCVTEREHNGKLEQAIDFDLLKQELSRSRCIVEGSQERYQLNWVGKADATVLANTPINKTLRPCREESVNFDNTENLFIEGDNLDALKLLQETYLGKVKMIYIDPPYNTGTAMLYKNDFSISETDFLEKSGQIDSDRNHLTTNLKTNGRFHSDWLSMMFSRLKITRNLLREDGFVILAMDDSEIENLIKISDEVFGSENRIGIITVVHKPEGRNQEKFLGTSNEFALIYAKNKQAANFRNVILDNEKLMEYQFSDERGKYRKKNFIRKADGKYATREAKPKFWYPIYVSKDLSKVSLEKHDDWYEVLPIIESGVERTWKTLPETFMELYVNNNICVENENGNIVVYEKLREKQVIKTHWIKKEYHAYHFGTKVLDELLDNKTFDFPKSLYLIIDLLKLTTSDDDLILDFFAGSATTAHAVMQLNAEDGGNRKFIMVQIPEKTDEKSEAYKAGYQTIAEISKERIRRAGQKIVQDLADNQKSTEHLDIGFRVLKIDSSNMADIYYTPQQLQQGDMFNQVEHIKADRSEEDLLFQVLLDWGVDLTLPIEKRVINGKNVFFVDQNVLVACFDKEIDEELIKAITQYQPLRAVFRDDGFINDTTKINAEQLFKQLAPHSELRVI